MGIACLLLIRFKEKANRERFEILKLIALILLVIYPLPFYSLVAVANGDFWIVNRFLTFVILAAIFVYDRRILKPGKMKRKNIIVLYNHF